MGLECPVPQQSHISCEADNLNVVALDDAIQFHGWVPGDVHLTNIENISTESMNNSRCCSKSQDNKHEKEISSP